MASGRDGRWQLCYGWRRGFSNRWQQSWGEENDEDEEKDEDTTKPGTKETHFKETGHSRREMTGWFKAISASGAKQSNWSRNTERLCNKHWLNLKGAGDRVASAICMLQCLWDYPRLNKASGAIKENTPGKSTLVVVDSHHDRTQDTGDRRGHINNSCPTNPPFLKPITDAVVVSFLPLHIQ